MKKQRKKPIPPKPFVKGDPRINRNGRPRKSDELQRMLLAKWDAPVVDASGKTKTNPETGKPLTYGEAVEQRLFNDPKLYPELLNRAWGKVKDEVESTGEVTIKIVYGNGKGQTIRT